MSEQERQELRAIEQQVRIVVNGVLGPLNSKQQTLLTEALKKLGTLGHG